MVGFRTTNDLGEQRDEALRLDEAARAQDPHRRRSSGKVRQSVTALYFEIQGADTLMKVDLIDEITVGRRDPNVAQIPELDLSSHAAYQLGISRRHALIRRVGDRLEIFDLGSKNGTKVNGKPVSPDQPVKLSNGDEISIGRMTLRLILPNK